MKSFFIANPVVSADVEQMPGYRRPIGPLATNL